MFGRRQKKHVLISGLKRRVPTVTQEVGISSWPFSTAGWGRRQRDVFQMCLFPFLEEFTRPEKKTRFLLKRQINKNKQISWPPLSCLNKNFVSICKYFWISKEKLEMINKFYLIVQSLLCSKANFFPLKWQHLVTTSKVWKGQNVT